jgi:hypothetical protein
VDGANTALRELLAYKDAKVIQKLSGVDVGNIDLWLRSGRVNELRVEADAVFISAARGNRR